MKGRFACAALIVGGALVASANHPYAQISAPERVATPGAIAAASANKTIELARFDTSGVYSWTVPDKVKTVTFDVFGASGGDSTTDGTTVLAQGGAGGEAVGTFATQPGQVILIFVGGRGQNGNGQTAGLGGFNGGGFAADGNGTVYIGGAGGGGGSDVRIGNVFTSNTCNAAIDPNQQCHFGDRIVVAGGGGGGGGVANAPGAQGGGVHGNGSGTLASGGTQEFGGAGSFQSLPYSEGQFGRGGSITNTTNSMEPGAGGGGGGWYGGGLYGAAGGGGGSGSVSPFAISGSFPGGTRTGDGLVIISAP